MIAGMQGSRFKAGEWVVVRSKEEILRTLDKRGQLDNMPFMPSMFQFCGKRIRVAASAHKTCDTINKTGGRGVASSAHLEDTRCDGSGYDGCGALCMIFWKDAWLKPADGPDTAGVADSGAGCTEADVKAGARGPTTDGQTTYVCQATELVNYTTPLPWWDVRQYIEDYKSKNAGARRLAEGFTYALASGIIRAARDRPRVENALIAIYDRVQSLWGGVPYPRKTGTIPAGQKTPPCNLNLQPGELVRVKSHKEILETLDEASKNRGLYFDAEDVPYCGGTYQVRSRVNKIVDERTGKMLEFKSGSVILDGVDCKAKYSDRRMF